MNNSANMKAIDQLCVYLFTRRLFNPIQDGPFWGSSRLGGGGGGGGGQNDPSVKPVTRVTTIMKLGTVISKINI